MTEYQALARIDAVPLTLTGGRSLQDWLAHETALGPEGARRAIIEYRRFLALSLTAPRDAPAMPPPLVQQVWQRHRDDGAAYHAFCSALDCGYFHHNVSRWQITRAEAYRQTRARYHAAFRALSQFWWPHPALLAIRTRLTVVWIVLAIGCVFFGVVDRIESFWAILAIYGVVAALLLAGRFLPIRFREYEGPRGSLAMRHDGPV